MKLLNIISIKAIIKLPSTTKFIINTKSMVPTLFIKSIRNKPTSTRKNIMLRNIRATIRKLTITRRSQLLSKSIPPKVLR